MVEPAPGAGALGLAEEARAVEVAEWEREAGARAQAVEGSRRVVVAQRQAAGQAREVPVSVLLRQVVQVQAQAQVKEQEQVQVQEQASDLARA